MQTHYTYEAPPFTISTFKNKKQINKVMLPTTLLFSQCVFINKGFQCMYPGISSLHNVFPLNSISIQNSY